MMDFELLSSAITIVHGNDIYKPIIRRRPDGIFAEYCIGGVNTEHMNFVESEREKEWSNAYMQWKKEQEDNKC